MKADASRSSAASPEFSLSLAGSVVRSRYRVNAVSAVHRDVAIYSAEDVRQGRSIALKVLRDDFARDSKFADAVRSQASALAVSGHVLRGVQRVQVLGEVGGAGDNELAFDLLNQVGVVAAADDEEKRGIRPARPACHEA